ncbi:MAG: hypothetical protein NWQ28_06390 [Nodularia sp. (in: cyanobacteria)]|nr:hypothetical protein [Nodularia sp. (in: cyanobacteria)]
MNKFIIGLFTLSAIALASTPANARPNHVDNAQIINQRSVTTGNHNRSINNAGQNNLNVNKNAGGNSANGQAIGQECDSFGDGNVCLNSASQNNQQIHQRHQQRNHRSRGRYNH